MEVSRMNPGVGSEFLPSFDWQRFVLCPLVLRIQIIVQNRRPNQDLPHFGFHRQAIQPWKSSAPAFLPFIQVNEERQHPGSVSLLGMGRYKIIVRAIILPLFVFEKLQVFVVRFRSARHMCNAIFQSFDDGIGSAIILALVELHAI